ncbi:hypothetical protein E3N88_09233 [Mikania micrantha]|uniref:Uncharacterized protein n=1 Tax=Mikania micrantha TaxID=192012 RepID=A0A5N6PJD6_9ASTR|nr:hypothetical protein E3N88_09233 [Mikania micrantha]
MQRAPSHLNNLWYVDNGGSRHMTGCRSILNNFTPKNGESVSFGNDAKGWIVRSGSVSSGKLHFNDVSLAENHKFNLLSVLIDQHTLLTSKRRGNVYVVNMSIDSQSSTPTYFIANASSSKTILWNRRFNHLNHQSLHKLSTLSLVRGLPFKEFHFEGHYDSCIKEKQHKLSYKSIEESKTATCLHMLHMDLFGLVKASSLARKKYCLIFVDDYSIFCWTFFLFSKDETADKIKALIT